MKKNIIIVIVLILAVAAVLILKNKKQELNTASETKQAVQSTNSVDSNQQKLSIENRQAEKQSALPRLIDLGADKCMACKAMEPVLEKLREEYKGKLQVDFIDVWKNPAPARKYNIRSIPTQIFFDSDGKEIYRHIGFISEEDILKTFKEKGVLN